MSSHPVI